ncbi:hypothetical protein VPH35_094537 [Triticum aestivum]
MDHPPHLDIDLNEPPPPSPPSSPVPADLQSSPREFAAAIPVVGPSPPPPPPPQLPPATNVQAHLLLPHQARELALAYHRAESWRLASATASAPATAGSSLEVPPPLVLQSPIFAPPPPLPPQLPPPANVQADLLLTHQAREIGMAYQRGEWWRSAIASSTVGSWVEVPHPAPAQHLCVSCGLPMLSGTTIICYACERRFHASCIHHMRPTPIQPPLPTPSVGVRGPPAAVNKDWMCPECAIGAVNARDITRQLCQLPLDHLLMVLHLFLFSGFYTHSSKK